MLCQDNLSVLALFRTSLEAFLVRQWLLMLQNLIELKQISSNSTLVCGVMNLIFGFPPISPIFIRSYRYHTLQRDFLSNFDGSKIEQNQSLIILKHFHATRSNKNLYPDQFISFASACHPGDAQFWTAYLVLLSRCHAFNPLKTRLHPLAWFPSQTDSTQINPYPVIFQNSSQSGPLFWSQHGSRKLRVLPCWSFLLLLLHNSLFLRQFLLSLSLLLSLSFSLPSCSLCSVIGSEFWTEQAFVFSGGGVCLLAGRGTWSAACLFLSKVRLCVSNGVAWNKM